MIKLRMVVRAVVTALLVMVSLSVMVFANPYPATLDDGNLVLVDGGMGVGRYAERSSVAVERYMPPEYQIAIAVYSVTFSEEYWRQHETYVGGPYKIGQSLILRFRYHWGRKTIVYEHSDNWAADPVHALCPGNYGGVGPGVAESAAESLYSKLLIIYC